MRLSIKEVIKTLFEAIVLVVLVVYLFLQSFRTTIICTVAIVVALIATFTGMLALGFSINLLTLFGLVLAIGMVVDDAIVVVENVERNMAQHHLEPKEATIRSMEEIGSSLVAVVLVMCSVFIPAAFLPGTTGQLYKQFAITIVISVSVSGFIALTLTPAMCAVMLRHTPPSQRGFFAWFNRQVDAVTPGIRPRGGVGDRAYRSGAVVARRLSLRDLASVPRVADELRSQRRPGLRDGRRHHAAGREPLSYGGDRGEGRCDFQGSPGVATRTMVTGYSLLDSGFKTNAATLFVTFKDFDERYKTLETTKEQNARAILQGFFAKARVIEGAIVIPIAPPAIPGIGTTGGFEFWVQDTGPGDPVALDDVMQDFLKKARERSELTGLATTYSATRSSCAPTSTARRHNCSAFRSRTSTARSRRSSARSR